MLERQWTIVSMCQEHQQRFFYINNPILIPNFFCSGDIDEVVKTVFKDVTGQLPTAISIKIKHGLNNSMCVMERDMSASTNKPKNR